MIAVKKYMILFYHKKKGKKGGMEEEPISGFESYEDALFHVNSFHPARTYNIQTYWEGD